MTRKPSGFTLIELMIVVAIIAILAAIAFPAYQDYVIRSQVAEGPVVSDSVKDAVWAYVADQGHMPADNASAGLPLATSITGKFVHDVAVGSGKITVTYGSTSPQRANASIAGKFLIFSPLFGASSGSISWVCQPTVGTVDQKYLPSICRQGSN